MSSINNRLSWNFFWGILFITVISNSLITNTAFCEEEKAVLTQSEERYAHADALYNSDKFAEAKVLYEYVHQNSSDSNLKFWSQYQVIRCGIILSDSSLVEEWIKKLKDNYSEQIKLYDEIYKLANRCRKLNKYDKARSLYQYLSLNSTDSNRAFMGQTRVVGCEMDLGNYTAADQAIEILKGDNYKHQYQFFEIFLHAKRYCALKKYYKARDLFEYVSQNSPDNKLSLRAGSNAARCSTKMRQSCTVEQAVAMLDEENLTDEVFVDKVLFICSVFIHKNDPAMALPYINSALESTTDNTKKLQLLSLKTECYISMGASDQANAIIASLKANHSQKNPELCESIKDIAMKYWFAKKYDKAREHYYYVSENISDKKESLFCYKRALKCELRLNNQAALDEALATLDADLASETYLDLVRIICSVYIESNDPAPALPHIIQALESTDDLKVALELLKLKAKVYIDMGAVDEAQAVEAEIALYADQEYYPGVQFAIAERYRVNGKYQKAIEEYKKVLTSKADEDQQLYAHVGIARSYFKKDGDPNTIGTIKTLITDFAKNDKLGWGLYVIAEDYYFAKQYKLARDMAILAHERANCWDIPGESAYLIAHCSGYLHDYETEIQYFKKILDKYPKSKFAHRVPYRLGKRYRRIRDYEKAEYWFKKQCELYDDWQNGSRATYSLAILYRQQLKNPAKALEVFENYKKRYPEGEKINALPYLMAGSYQKLGLYTEAIAILNEAVKEKSKAKYKDECNTLLNKIQEGTK